MTIVAAPIPSGARLIDTDERISPEKAKELAAYRDPDGGRITGVCRYGPLSGNALGKDLTRAEAVGLWDAGLGIVYVQHVRFPPWTPTSMLGSADGLAVVHHLRELEFPVGMSPFYDMEGCAPGTKQGVIDYDHAHSAIVVAGGFFPGGYFGFDVPLTAEEMWLLHVVRYFRAGNEATAPTNCGWCIEQDPRFDQHIVGLDVDRDTAHPDALGRSAMWAIDDRMIEAV